MRFKFCLGFSLEAEVEYILEIIFCETDLSVLLSLKLETLLPSLLKPKGEIMVKFPNNMMIK